MNEKSIGTKCVQAGYRPGNGEPRQIPIIQSTTFKYDTSQDMGRLFDLEASGYFYTRLQNPTNDYVAAKIAALEGGSAAMLTSSGQAANFYAVFNIASCGDHVVASSSIYGGTYNLFAVTMKKMGVDFTFVSPYAADEELDAAFKPNTTVVAASENHDIAVAVQEMFSTDFLRVYTGTDVTGVELGGALKNIIALGAGISDGLGFGDNAKAAMMTRGIAEMKRLGVKMGADVNTFAGLTGIGDLIVTCTSMHSRNRRCGIMIGEGMAPEEAVKNVGMVVEGMFTAEAAYELADRLGVEMPITNEIYKLIKGQITGKEAVMNLMGRERKPED